MMEATYLETYLVPKRSARSPAEAGDSGAAFSRWYHSSDSRQPWGTRCG